jgi:hypothetical protein
MQALAFGGARPIHLLTDCGVFGTFLRESTRPRQEMAQVQNFIGVALQGREPSAKS